MKIRPKKSNCAYGTPIETYKYNYYWYTGTLIFLTYQKKNDIYPQLSLNCMNIIVQGSYNWERSQEFHPTPSQNSQKT